MTARFMLDTDICSYFMRRSHRGILDRMSSLTTSDVCISAIVKAELLFGVAIGPPTSSAKLAVSVFLETIVVEDFPDAAADHYADIRADLTKQGTLIGANDLLIAAHARCLGMILVTNNVREFSRVRKLAIENWTEL